MKDKAQGMFLLRTI